MISLQRTTDFRSLIIFVISIFSMSASQICFASVIQPTFSKHPFMFRMYALIYDEFDPAKREKRVVFVHKTRVTAEEALAKRQHKLGKRVWDCNTRIVWVHDQVHNGDTITPNSFDTWAPAEKIPAGDRVPDVD